MTDAGKLLSIVIRSDIAKLNRCTVADVSVMLAFMASRNVRETMAIVHEGKVMPPSGLLVLIYFLSQILVAAIHLGSLYILWSSIKYI